LTKVQSSNPYSDDSFSGIDHTLINLPPNWDIRQGYMPDGTPVFLSSSTNPQPSLQWQIANEYNTETKQTRKLPFRDIPFSAPAGAIHEDVPSPG